jgi:hypothetical protein
MKMIPITEAAAQAGTTANEIETWAARGLLQIHTVAGSACVEQEQFQDIVDSLGWLQLSGQGWDDAGDE